MKLYIAMLLSVGAAFSSLASECAGKVDDAQCKKHKVDVENYCSARGWSYYLPNDGMISVRSNVSIASWSSIQSTAYKQCVKKELLKYIATNK